MVQTSFESIQLLEGECQIRSYVPLGSLTTLRVGGEAEWFVAPRTLDALTASLAWAHAEGMGVTLLGAGSNLLVSDRGIPGLTIYTRYLRQTVFDEETGRVTAGAGESLARLAWRAAKRGWRGLEWAVGIPGTIGGAVVMNAGAQGGCTADVFVDAHVVTPDGQTLILASEDLAFGYRSSALQEEVSVADQRQVRLVAQATFQLQPGEAPAQVMEETTTNLKHRHETQPYDSPNCGSVFRNPGPKAAGWLIENTGLKGFQIGEAQVSQLHANFILNCGQATAGDVFRLIRHVQGEVHQQWSLLLEPEVRMLGEFQF